MYVHLLVILSWLKALFPQNGLWGETGCLTDLINNSSVIFLLEPHNQQAQSYATSVPLCFYDSNIFSIILGM